MKILKNKPISVNNLKDFNENGSKIAKRSLREPILKAFDIYKSNVYYGIITETEEERTKILAWYQDLLDLKESALGNVPKKVEEYLK